MTTQSGPSRVELKERELKFLFEVYKKHPELFDRPTFIEDAKTLEEFGIYVPGKESFPFGVIKFVPNDFIVEEVSEAGEICTIQKENILSTSTALPEAPTLYATIVKCGLSTLTVVDELTKILSCSSEQIRYAGIKDKDAITAQRFSFRQISLERLKTVSSPHFFLKDVSVGKGVLEKGRLKGNQFTLFVRVEKSFFEQKQTSVFVRELEGVRERGFYNYFYLQRFGTPRLASHYFGLDLIHGYYRKAIESFISFASPHEIPYFRNIRRELGSYFGHWNAMLQLMEPFPLVFANELKVVRYLKEKPDDFAGALHHISDQAGMWFNAVSSWLFNQKIASYVVEDKEPPSRMPLFFDPANPFHLYADLMKKFQISPEDFRNLRRLPFIRPPRKPLATREPVAVDKAEILDSGILLKFFLPKGEYATTFLSHLFNLISDRPPIEINQSVVDTKAILGEPSTAAVIEYFSPVIFPKSRNYFEELLKEEGR